MFPFYCFPLEARAHTLKSVATVPLHNECHTTSETTAAKPADAEACPFRLVFCLSFRANQFGLGGSREHTALERCVGARTARHEAGQHGSNDDEPRRLLLSQHDRRTPFHSRQQTAGSTTDEPFAARALVGGGCGCKQVFGRIAFHSQFSSPSWIAQPSLLFVVQFSERSTGWGGRQCASFGIRVHLAATHSS